MCTLCSRFETPMSPVTWWAAGGGVESFCRCPGPPFPYTRGAVSSCLWQNVCLLGCLYCHLAECLCAQLLVASAGAPLGVTPAQQGKSPNQDSERKVRGRALHPRGSWTLSWSQSCTFSLRSSSLFPLLPPSLCPRSLSCTCVALSLRVRVYPGHQAANLLVMKENFPSQPHLSPRKDSALLGLGDMTFSAANLARST